jgi:hypothetical protein
MGFDDQGEMHDIQKHHGSSWSCFAFCRAGDSCCECATGFRPRKGSSAYRSSRRQRQCKGNPKCRERKLAFCPWQNTLGCERRFHSRRLHRRGLPKSRRWDDWLDEHGCALWRRSSLKFVPNKNRYPHRSVSQCGRGSARRNLHDAGRNIRSD